MIPPVIREQDCHSFKFWYNNQIQDGMFYRNELFYRLQTVETDRRVKLYQRACQLAQQDDVVVTTSEQTCSVWLSLRSSSCPILSV